jgi:hypothetical protein
MELNNKSGIQRLAVIMCLAPILFFSGCKVSYSFSGASISPSIKTFSVRYFQNRASIVQPNLGQYITDALIDKCKSQTNLKYTTGDGDVSIEGEITDYNSKPRTVSADAQAAMNRFSITVKVKYTNTVDPDLSYDQSFTRYEDFDSNLNFSNVEKELSDKIVEMLIEDIFNKSFVNW